VSVETRETAGRDETRQSGLSPLKLLLRLAKEASAGCGRALGLSSFFWHLSRPVPGHPVNMWARLAIGSSPGDASLLALPGKGIAARSLHGERAASVSKGERRTWRCLEFDEHH
jgi:hypothetical protein